jgi:hypothetical protein
MKIRFKIFLTNWINFAGIFMAVYLSTAVSELLTIQSASDLPNALITGFLFGLFAIILYGSIFWAGFFISMFVLDYILLNKNEQWLGLKLFIEWSIISTPFIYWYIKYTEVIFLIAVIAFFVTQIIRGKRIIKLLS